jgi:hypothetical protein
VTRWPARVAVVAPLLLVNTAAVYGQYGWAYDHLGHTPITAALFAAAVESIGIYLAYEAHAALMAGDASARLRLASYAVGALVGCLNYAHFTGPGYRPNPLAVTFGLLSSISPWLWSIRSRSLNRDRLRELGQIDPRAVRFSILRWTLFPVRTFRAFRGAVWAGIVQPAEATAAEDHRRSERRAARVSGTPAESTPMVEVVTESAEPVPAVSAQVEPETVSTPRQPRARRYVPTTADRVTKYAVKNPDASPDVIAKRLGVTARTVRRHLNAATPAESINGAAVPELVEVTS